jgi:ABC-type phosphate transport system permease subunit
MNPFTTDHPLAARSSWFDTREHPVLSFVCSSVVLALMLAPFVLHRLYLYAISDIGAEPNPFPQPWWALFWGSVIAFVLSLFVAVPVVFLFRLFIRRRRRYVVA